MMGMAAFLSLQGGNAGARPFSSTMRAQHPGDVGTIFIFLHSSHTETIRSPYGFQTPDLEGPR